MKSLILIPCCRLKAKNGSEDYRELKRNSIVFYLSKEYGERLLELRRRVALAFRELPGPDFGCETNDAQIKFLEANKRYNGRLCGRISEDSWNTLKIKPEIRLIMISALYGLLNYNEPIRYYNRSMKDHIFLGRLLKTWWKMNSLTDILLEYIVRNDIMEVHDFLSGEYRDALENLHMRCESIGVFYSPYNYRGLGSGADFHRGIDVNNFIQNFKANNLQKI